MFFETDQFVKRTSAQLSIRTNKDYREAHDLAAKLFALTNRMGGDVLGLAVADAFNQEHRTLQQNCIKHIVKPILFALDWSADQGAVDARNEDSVEWARAALDATKDKGLRFV